MPRRRAFTVTELLVVIGIMGVVLALILPALQRVRETANRLVCHIHLRQIGMALHHYHGHHDAFPPALLTDGPQRHMTWLARLLPYLEQEPIAAQTRHAFAQDWRFWGPPHIPIRTKVQTLFICPSEGRTVSQHQILNAAYTHYLGVSGDRPGRGVLFANRRIRTGEITDGLSYTFIVGERPPSSNERYGWWYAGLGQDQVGTLDSHMAAEQMNHSFYAPHLPLGPYTFGPGRSDDLGSMFHFWSAHPGGANFLAAGGNVTFLHYNSAHLLPALCSRAGRENATFPE